MYGNEQMQYRMQIEWNEKTTEWFRRASAFTGFHRNLTEILLRHLDGSRTICDLGCGAARRSQPAASRTAGIQTDGPDRRPGRAGYGRQFKAEGKEIRPDKYYLGRDLFEELEYCEENPV